MRLPDTKDLRKVDIYEHVPLVGPFKLRIVPKDGYFYISTAKGVICCDGLLIGSKEAIEPLLNYLRARA